jgi:hypothetical protein
MFVRLACMRHVNTRLVAAEKPMSAYHHKLSLQEIAERKKAREARVVAAYDGKSPYGATACNFRGEIEFPKLDAIGDE